MVRLEELLFPSITDVTVMSVAVNDEAVHIEARSTAAGAVCPGCGSWSQRVHSSYPRFSADVPSGGRRVAHCLRVRRFLCPVISCGRRTFAEQLPGLTRRYGRRTERLRSTLAAVGLALAGRAGARLASVFGVSVSRSTVLRLVEALPDPEVPALRWSASMSTRPAKAATTGPSWSTSKAGVQWTCCPIGRHPAWPLGSRSGPRWRWRCSASIVRRSSPKVPRPGRPKRCRWRIGGTFGTT